MRKLFTFGKKKDKSVEKEKKEDVQGKRDSTEESPRSRKEGAVKASTSTPNVRDELDRQHAVQSAKPALWRLLPQEVEQEFLKKRGHWDSTSGDDEERSKRSLFRHNSASAANRAAISREPEFKALKLKKPKSEDHTADAQQPPTTTKSGTFQLPKLRRVTSRSKDIGVEVATVTSDTGGENNNNPATSSASSVGKFVAKLFSPRGSSSSLFSSPRTRSSAKDLELTLNLSPRATSEPSIPPTNLPVTSQSSSSISFVASKAVIAEETQVEESFNQILEDTSAPPIETTSSPTISSVDERTPTPTLIISQPSESTTPAHSDSEHTIVSSTSESLLAPSQNTPTPEVQKSEQKSVSFTKNSFLQVALNFHSSEVSFKAGDVVRYLDSDDNNIGWIKASSCSKAIE